MFRSTHRVPLHSLDHVFMILEGMASPPNETDRSVGRAIGRSRLVDHKAGVRVTCVAFINRMVPPKSLNIASRGGTKRVAPLNNDAITSPYGVRGRGHGAGGTGYGARGTGHGARGTGHGARGRAQGAGCRVEGQGQALTLFCNLTVFDTGLVYEYKNYTKIL